MRRMVVTKGLIEIKKSRYGRGIFATRTIQKGALIHEAPVIVCPNDEYRKLQKTVLRNYYFNWGENYDHVAIALGYGSLFNHSYTPNAVFENNLKKETVDFFALKKIKAGEEILVNYNGDPNDKKALWFDVW
jgi:uncharacterized protein